MSILDKIAKKMKSIGIGKYQLSIDGLEKKHDYIRKKGSFRDSIRAIEILKKNNIQVMIMLTLSKFNEPDFQDLVRIPVREYHIDAFTFARFVKPENMSLKEYEKVSFTPAEYRDFLEKTNNLFNSLSQEGYKTKFPLKDHLWKLYFYEKDDLLKAEDYIWQKLEWENYMSIEKEINNLKNLTIKDINNFW